nr:hypothetical protein [Enterobacter roggenkampii]
MFAGKKSAQIREILISESAWEEMTCLFAPSLTNADNKDIEIPGDMIVPYGTLVYHFPQVSAVSGRGIFKYNYITDLGAYIKRTYNF